MGMVVHEMNAGFIELNPLLFVEGRNTIDENEQADGVKIAFHLPEPVPVAALMPEFPRAYIQRAITAFPRNMSWPWIWMPIRTGWIRSMLNDS